MRPALTLALGLAATTTNAATTFSLTSNAWKKWTWSVSNYDGGCARTCYYDFNITIPADSTLPAIPLKSSVLAYCWGYETGDTFRPCTVLMAGNQSVAVAAKLGPRDANDASSGVGPKLIAMSAELAQEGTRFNYTGYADAIYNQFVAPPQNFTLMPSEAYGVA